MKTRITLLLFMQLLTNCTQNDYFPAKSYSGIVIDGNTRKPLANTQVGITGYEWEWEYNVFPVLYEYTIDTTSTDTYGKFFLEDKEFDATSIWFDNNKYARTIFYLNDNVRNNFIVELYPKSIFSLGITGTYSFISQVSFSVESTKKVIYSTYPDKTIQKFTFGTSEVHTRPFVWWREDFVTGNYKLSVQYNNYKSEHDITIGNNDTLFYKIDFRDRIIFSAIDPSGIKPLISTLPVSNISYENAYFNWQIQDNENSVFFTTGIVWSENPGPTVDLNKGYQTAEISGDKYGCNIYPLLSGKTYFARPFVRAFYKVFYGNEVTFTTLTSQ